MRIEPAGHRVIVKPDPLSEVEEKELQKYEQLKSSGFEIADQVDKKRREQSVHIGTLVAVGMTAWLAYDKGEPWAKVGDRVYFCRNSGELVEEDNQKYRIMNDQDVLAIIREDSGLRLVQESIQ